MSKSITSPESYETVARVIKRHGNYSNAAKNAIMIGELIYVGDKSKLPPHFLPGFKGEVSQKEIRRIQALRMADRTNKKNYFSFIALLLGKQTPKKRIIISSMTNEKWEE